MKEVLKRCKQCGFENFVKKKADECPQCGGTLKNKSKDLGSTGTLIFIAVIAGIVSFFVFYGKTSEKPEQDLKIISAKMLSNKVIEFCLNRRLKQRESYIVMITFKPKTAEQIIGGWHIGNRFDDMAKCYKLNAFNLTSRHNDDRNIIIKEHVKKDNIEYIHIKLKHKKEAITEARFVDL